MAKTWRRNNINEINGFKITVDIGCDDISHEKLIDIENAITNIVEMNGCILLNGKASFESYPVVKKEEE